MRSVFDWVKSHYLSEYLYFCRYGLLAVVTVFLLPFIAPAIAPAMLANLFVVDAIGVFFVTLIGLLAAMSGVYILLLTWRSVPARHELPFKRGREWRLEIKSFVSRPILTRRRTIVAGMIAIPLIIAVVWQSSSDLPDATFAAALGLVAAALTRELGSMLADLRVSRRGLVTIRRLDPITSVIPTWRIYQRLPIAIRVLHLRAGAFFLAALLVYALIGYGSRPGSDVIPGQVPTLAYVLNIIMLLTWVMGALAFLCDRARVPIVLPIVVGLLLIQAVFPNDHVYRVEAYSGTPPTGTTSDAIRARHGGSPERPLVVVTASGGGIAASLWTGRVLEGITSSLPEFSDQVDVLSAVSGGTVATMLYVDRYANAGNTTANEVASIKMLAAEPSLSAVGWGLAYPDLWRNVLPPFIKESDRGSAQEVAWDRRLLNPGTLLRSWDQSVLDGDRPLPLFSATAQESGGRIVFAPLEIDEPSSGSGWTPGATRMRLEHLYDAHGCPVDVRVATAARLSSAFPFVSPHAQASKPISAGTIHAADGGYYDNSGIVTAIEVVDAFLATTEKASRPNRVVLVEIRTGEDPAILASRLPQRASGGIVNALRGPIDTLYNARTATQISRTRMELDLLARHWEREHGVEFVHVVFQLSGKLPLSWKLTQEEGDAIESHWPLLPLPPGGTPFGDTVRSNHDSLVKLLSAMR